MADVKTLIDLIGNTPMVQVKNMDTGAMQSIPKNGRNESRSFHKR
jgi:hypothetical protein